MRSGETKELSNQLAEQMRSIIQKKQMQPGSRFPSEKELIERFNVGRSTVREAIKILVTENLLEIRRGKGTYISQCPGRVKDPLGLQYSPQQKLLQNLFEARAIIEPQIAALAALRAEPKDIECLQQVLEEHLTCTDKSKNAELDVKFHKAVTMCCHNEVLQRFMPLVMEAIQEGRVETEAVPYSWENAKQYHKRIFEMIESGDAEAAKSEMKQHLLQTAKDANIKIQLGGKNL